MAVTLQSKQILLQLKDFLDFRKRVGESYAALDALLVGKLNEKGIQSPERTVRGTFAHEVLGLLEALCSALQLEERNAPGALMATPPPGIQIKKTYS